MSQDLRSAIPFEEFDYQALMGALADYARPRDKVTDLLAKGVIIRVKKGLYIFGEKWRRQPYSREILANLLYGPSCVSLDYALHYHGLTPERVEAVTSVTPKRAARFTTPVGLFLYSNVPGAGFAVGLGRVELEGGRAFLIATPEKALADKVRQGRGLGLRSQKEILMYLVEDLRIDESALRDLDAGLLLELSEAYRSPRVALLASLVRRLARSKG
jgi:predicted transcriptional regulator of viral defense system